MLCCTIEFTFSPECSRLVTLVHLIVIVIVNTQDRGNNRRQNFAFVFFWEVFWKMK